jgi:hypothetical protein
MKRREQGMAMTLDKLTTVKSGRAYRAVISGTVHFFEVDQDNTGVFVRTLARTLGGYRLDRFGDGLSPTTLRAFLLDSWRVSVA